MPKYPQAGILSCPPMRSLEYKCSIKRHFGIKKSPWVNEASCVKRFECLSSAKKTLFPNQSISNFIPACVLNQCPGKTVNFCDLDITHKYL